MHTQPVPPLRYLCFRVCVVRLDLETYVYLYPCACVRVCHQEQREGEREREMLYVKGWRSVFACLAEGRWRWRRRNVHRSSCTTSRRPNSDVDATRGDKRSERRGRKKVQVCLRVCTSPRKGALLRACRHHTDDNAPSSTSREMPRHRHAHTDMCVRVYMCVYIYRYVCIYTGRVANNVKQRHNRNGEPLYSKQHDMRKSRSCASAP